MIRAKGILVFCTIFIAMIELHENDLIEMKKKHPCGSARFRIGYLGSDVKISCLGCGREMLMARIKLEKMIKKVIEQDD